MYLAGPQSGRRTLTELYVAERLAVHAHVNGLVGEELIPLNFCAVFRKRPGLTNGHWDLPVSVLVGNLGVMWDSVVRLLPLNQCLVDPGRASLVVQNQRAGQVHAAGHQIQRFRDRALNAGLDKEIARFRVHVMDEAIGLAFEASIALALKGLMVFECPAYVT